MNSCINIQNNQNSENKASRILFMQSFETPKVFFFLAMQNMQYNHIAMHGNETHQL